MAVDMLDKSVTEALRSLKIQHASGIPVEASLTTCANLCTAPSGRNCFLDAAKRAQNGDSIESLLDALAPLLTETERATVAAGWNGGRIEAVLDSVVQQRELWASARRHIRAQMIMPVMVLIIASFVGPLPNLIAHDGSIAMYLFSVAIPLVIGFVGWTMLSKALWSRPAEHGLKSGSPPALPTTLDRYKLSFPIFASVERNRCLAEFSSCMANLLAAGVPITSALETCARAMSNGVYRQSVAAAALVTKGGNLLTTALFPQELWPTEFVSTVQVGETSGTLDEVLTRYAEHARESYIRAVDAFAQWLPRIMYGLVALFVIYNIFVLAGQYIGMINDALKPG